MTAAIYQLADGKILRFVTCPPDHVDLQCHDGEEFFLNCPADATHIIDNLPVTVPKPPPSVAEQRKTVEKRVQSELDATAQANGNWDSMLSARAAAMLPGPFQAQALTLANWWSAVWAYCYQVLDDVDNGLRPIPTPDELVAELPPFET